MEYLVARTAKMQKICLDIFSERIEQVALILKTLKKKKKKNLEACN